MSTESAIRPPVLVRYRRAFDKVGPPIFLGIVPVLFFAWVLIFEVHHGDVAVDFHHELYPEAKLVAHGTNPYPPPDADLSSGTNTIWPIAAVLPFLPLSYLSPGVADGLMTAFVIATLLATLAVLGVRDWRVFGATLVWPGVINAVQTANLTLPLGLLAALVWRYRRVMIVPGIALGVALAAKFFLWPLAVWLAAVRRWREALLACVLAIASLGLILPFASLGDYFHLVRNLSDTFDGESYTIYGFLTDAGVTSGAARAANLVVGIALLALAWRRHSFALTMGAALVLSPIVWLHFLALLVVPFAIASPTFSAIWLLPLVTWLAPGTYNGRPWQSGLVLAFLGVAMLWCARRETAPRPRQRPTVATARAS